MQEKYFYCRKEINRRQFQSYCIEFNYASESDSPVVFFFTEYGNLQGWAKKGPIQILYRNSVLRYAIALNFGRNTTIIAINSNWYIE